MVMQSRHEYVTLDPVGGGGFLVRTAVQVPLTSPGDEPRMLEAVYPIERRLGELADTVESAYQRYGEKARLREPLKTSFTLTLTLVLLLSLFAALYGAFWSARRLVRPIQDLVPARARSRKATSTCACRSPRTTRWASWCTRSTT